MKILETESTDTNQKYENRKLKHAHTEENVTNVVKMVGLM